jgi:hypothetical protein
MNSCLRLAIRLVWTCVFISSQFLLAQVALKITSVTPIENQGRTALMSPFKCDESGRIYVQLPDPKIFMNGPLLRISADGKNTVRYSLDFLQDVPGASIADFAVSPTGETSVLIAAEGNRAYVARFDSDGKFLSMLKLEKEFEAHRIGVFATGDFVVTGSLANPRATAANLQHAFTGLFDTQGRLLKEILPSRDIKPNKSEGKRLGGPDKDYDRAISGSILELADGNLYLARLSPSGPVYVIAPSGEIVRRISLQAPEQTQLSSIKVSHGRLVAMYIRHKNKLTGEIDHVVFSVLDSQTGREYAKYRHSSAALGVALACYTPETFTFLATAGDQSLQIIRAEPE